MGHHLVPSGNHAWQWKIHSRWVFPSKPPKNIGKNLWDFPANHVGLLKGSQLVVLHHSLKNLWCQWGLSYYLGLESVSNVTQSTRTCWSLLVNCICYYVNPYIHMYLYMSDYENPRFTERTSTNLGRSHRLPHVCTIMIYGKLGGYRLQETAAFIYIYMRWTMNNMWYLGIANVDIREIWWHNLEKGYR